MADPGLAPAAALLQADATLTPAAPATLAEAPRPSSPAPAMAPAPASPLAVARDDGLGATLLASGPELALSVEGRGGPVRLSLSGGPSALDVSLVLPADSLPQAQARSEDLSRALAEQGMRLAALSFTASDGAPDTRPDTAPDTAPEGRRSTGGEPGSAGGGAGGGAGGQGDAPARRAPGASMPHPKLPVPLASPPAPSRADRYA